MRKLEYIAYMFLKYGFNTSVIRSAFNILFSTSPYVTIRLKPYKHPIYLRRKGSDLEVFYEIMLRFGYRWKTKIVPMPRTIVDCGANIGLAAIYFKSVYPDAKMVVVEPESENFKLLQKNLEKYDNIVCLNKGIWHHHAYLAISNPEASSYGFTLKEVSEESGEGIESFSIRDLMEREGMAEIDLLKIDIEGSEKELFDSEYDYWLSRSHTVVVELHDGMKEGCSHAFFKAMSHYNFAMEVRGENLICRLKH